MKTLAAGASQILSLPSPKDPADKLLYRMDWTHFLTPLADMIATSSWDGGGLTLSGEALETGNLAAAVWIAGGSAGTTYTVRHRIETTAGRTVQRSFKLRVEER
jgi:hypothetical protein